MPRQTRAAARVDDELTTQVHENTENVSPQVLTKTIADVGSPAKKANKKKKNRGKKGKKTADIFEGGTPEHPALDKDNEVESQSVPMLEQEKAETQTVPVLDAPQNVPIPSSPLRRSTRRKAADLEPQPISAAPEAIEIAEDNLAPSPEPEDGSPILSDKQHSVAQHGTPEGNPAEKDNTMKFVDADVADTTEAVQELQSIFQEPAEADDQPNDSVIADIIARTPAKLTPSPRAVDREDPIDALDALEDAIEEVGKALPMVGKVSKKTSPAPLLRRGMSTKSTVASAPKPSALTRQPPTKTGTPASKAIGKPPLNASSSIGPSAVGRTTVQRLSVGPKIATAKARQTSASSDAARPTSTSGTTNTPSKAVSDVKKRSTISALHTPPPPPKSTKPLTRPTFQLPGEIMAAKLKAQREERQKRMEDAAAKKEAETKSKAVNKPKTSEIRQAAASSARMSILAERNKNSEEILRKSIAASAKRPTSIAPRMPTGAGRPKSMVLASSTAGAPATEKRARPLSIHGTQGPTSNVARPRVPAPNGTTKRAPMRTASVSGKEVANRAKVEQTSKEQEIKDKAEAARKARSEAAERGRQASREWAEKMLKKNKASVMAKAADGPQAAIQPHIESSAAVGSSSSAAI